MKYTSADQAMFLLLVSKFVIWANENGYILTGGDLYRDPRLHGTILDKYPEWFDLLTDYQKNKISKHIYGEKNSFHKMRLAIDFNLYIKGKYMTKTEDYYPLGKYWKTLHPDCVWGGDFKSPDGNHFSFKEHGRKSLESIS